jgi:hypothetical protein
MRGTMLIVEAKLPNGVLLRAPIWAVVWSRVGILISEAL